MAPRKLEELKHIKPKESGQTLGVKGEINGQSYRIKLPNTCWIQEEGLLDLEQVADSRIQGKTINELRGTKNTGHE